MPLRSLIRTLCVVCCAMVGSSALPGIASGSEPAKIVSLAIEPAEITLRGADDVVQLLVTGIDAAGGEHDLTAVARFQSTSAAVVAVTGGVVSARGDGAARLQISLADPSAGELKAEVPVTVVDFSVDRQLNFANDVVPLLSKHSCNAGGCHGKATGQNGFKLSLLGFDPAADHDALVKQAHGRRVFPAVPQRSLILTKPTGELAHGGGKRFDVESSAYRLLKRWIEQGMPVGSKDDPEVESISVSPAMRVLGRNAAQQLRVMATYSDKTSKDVTAEAEYQSQQTDILAVDAHGKTSTLEAVGEGTIMVRFMGLVDVARISVPYGAPPLAEAYARFKPKNYVDELVLKKWRTLGIAPSESASDPEFLRRAYLDAIGTLPTPQEVRDFLADSAPDKRDKLIDRLLDRNEYASFWAGKWGDLLRNKRRNGDQARRGSYAFAAWIRQAFSQNMPYDQFVAAIITAQGNVTDAPPVVWYREVRNAVHQVNDTSQLFLGTRIQCANCHHHPYERWSQDDYWGLAAFYARLGSKQGDVPGENAIFVRKEGNTHQPRTGKQMKPKALGGLEYEYVRGEDPRQNLVEWMRTPDNRFFAPAISNRMWAHFMGVGLVDAVDDMRVTNPPSNPELLSALAKDFVEHRFDLKHLIRTIMTSEAYGLSSIPNEFNSKDRRNYARYVTRRMPAEVLLDAIDAVTGVQEKFNGFPQGTRAIDLPDESVGSYFLDAFGRSHRETPCECERTTAPNLAQVLHLMNSPEIQNKIVHGQGRIAKLVEDKKTPQEMIEELYLACFGRLPNPAEVTAALEYTAVKESRAALGDLLWVLLNSKEFLFNH